MKTRSRSCSLAIALLILVGATAEVPAQETLPSLDSLAAAWSGSGSAPSCTPSLGGDPVMRALGSEECVWSRTAYHGGWAQVTGTRYAQTGLASISWALQMKSREDALVLRDSLGQELRKRGLAEYPCVNEGRRWQRPGLGVEFYIGVVFPDSLLHVGVVATPLTDAIPDIMCPDVPKLPSRPPLPVPRRAASTQRTQRPAGDLTELALARR